MSHVKNAKCIVSIQVSIYYMIDAVAIWSLQYDPVNRCVPMVPPFQVNSTQTPYQLNQRRRHHRITRVLKGGALVVPYILHAQS